MLDRTKESGSVGEPLYLDVVTTFAEAVASGTVKAMPTIVGGRYGLSSKDFDPAMAKAVFDELKKPAPKRGFTVGIIDDVSHTSLDLEANVDIEPPEIVRALFFGLGADGTVGANKNSTKILASPAGRHAQGYFVYDSKKSGSYTISHLRFGPRPIRAPYLLEVGELHRCAQVRFPVQARYSRGRRTGRHCADQQSVCRRRSVGRAAARSATTDASTASSSST